MQSSESDETSGIVASLTHKDIYYIHNDSGDISRFFAINKSGALLSTCFYPSDKDGGSSCAIDCEDIAIGPGPQPGKSYIYLGDIGDNKHNRPFITIYRIPEPAAFTEFMHVKSVAIQLKYPDGPRDAETLMIDPVRKQLYIISKREDSVGVYSAPLFPARPADTLTLQKKGSIYFDGIPNYKWTTGGDISHDGKSILVRTYAKVYYWQRQGTEPIELTLARQSQELASAAEPQGEAICFTGNDKAFVCISEGKHANINFKQLPRSPAIP